ncbi:MAG TPA: protein kinase [Herpetosiphonaceae bacterium]
MLAAGTQLQQRYTIVRLLGQGGVGAVYEAQDSRLKRRVALKHLLLADPQVIKAFAHEAQLLGTLQHACLPRVSDHFAEGTDQFLVMDYIPGADLADQLDQRGQAFPVGQVLAWADQLLDVLDYLHTHQPPILHRDIKPHNLKVTARGMLMLLDFGLAKGTIATTMLTTTSSVRGYTPLYAPLEQIQGTGTGAQSDLYSVAATLYHLLVGAPAPDVLTRVAATINGQPDPLLPVHQRNPQVSVGVSEVLTQALRVGFAQRPASAAVMRQALQAPSAPAASGATVIVPAGQAATIAFPVMAAQPQARRRRRWWVAGGGLLLTSVMIGSFAVWGPGAGPAGTEEVLAAVPTASSTPAPSATRGAAPVPPTARPPSATRPAAPTTAASTTQPTATPEPSTPIPAPATATPQPVVAQAATATRARPTATPMPPTATRQPATATSIPPTATRQPPTATSIPPTATPVPPTATPIPPTNTPSVNRQYDGQWNGTTTQGTTVEFTVQDGIIVVFDFKFILGQCSDRLLYPYASLPIANGQASVTQSDKYGSITISWIFNGNSASGGLRAQRYAETSNPECTAITDIGWNATR